MMRYMINNLSKIRIDIPCNTDQHLALIRCAKLGSNSVAIHKCCSTISSLYNCIHTNEEIIVKQYESMNMLISIHI